MIFNLVKLFFCPFFLLYFIIGCSDEELNIPSQKINDGNTIEVYLDRATLPTIQQMAKIVDEESNNKKLILWHRYQIRDSDLLNSINAESFPTQYHLVRHLNEMLLNENFKHIIIHGNAYWAQDVIDVVKSIESLGLNTDIKLEIYDDGSAEYVLLYNFSKLPEQEQEYKISLVKANIKGSINGYHEFKHSIEEIYGLAQVYPTTYYMLRSDIFKTTLNLKTISDMMSGHIKQMQWGYFKKFNQKQKSIFYALTKFNPEELKLKYDESPAKNFIFIGSNSGTASAEQQINVIREAEKDNSDIITNSIAGYDLFFKGHPSATFNKQIINTLNMTEINNKIPFEALIMTNSLPDAVGGMGSSVFFSLPPSVENKFIFYRDGTNISDDALIQVMLKLNIVKMENIKLISSLQ